MLGCNENKMTRGAKEVLTETDKVELLTILKASQEEAKEEPIPPANTAF